MYQHPIKLEKMLSNGIDETQGSPDLLDWTHLNLEPWTFNL